MFAVFFETNSIPEGRPQYLVFPTNPNESVIFTRVSNGGRNGLNRWSVATEIPSDEFLVREPSAILISQRDIDQYLTVGLPATLTTKALSAHDKAAVYSDSSVSTETLADLADRVAAKDPTLEQWFNDGRRTRPVVAPATNIPRPAAPVVAPVATPTVVTPTAGQSNRHSMAVVPSPTVAQRYVHRTVAGKSDFEVLDYARANNINVLLYGPTGPGKTTSAMAYASQHGLPVFMVSGTVALEPSQLFGRYIPDGEGGFVWQDGGVTEVVRHGGVLILDEVNFIPSKIATVLFSLLAGTTRSITLLDHKGETIVANDDLLIIATMNPSYAGTQEMNAAFRNRFGIQINWGYDDTVEKALVPIKSIREFAKQLRAAEAKEEILTPTPTNALVDFIATAGGLGIDFAVSNFIARYDESEQPKVKLALDAQRANIEGELGLAPIVAVIETEEPVAASGPLTLSDIDLSDLSV